MNFAETATQTQLASIIAQGIAQGLALADSNKLDIPYVDDTFAALVGQTIAIRTVTMTNVGVLAAVMKEAFIFEEGAVWIANTGHWSTFCATGNADDVEPFGKGPVYVPKGGVIDICLMPKIPSKKK